MIARRIAVAVAATAWCVSVSKVGATDECGLSVARRTVVTCVLAASPSLQRERAGIAVLEGRQKAVRPWLPSNPQLALSAAHRRNDEIRAGNWYATLSQELEIAGQRGARIDAASAATDAQRYNAVAEERNVAAIAWRAYFEALGAREELNLATRLEQALASGPQAASAAAAQGLVSGVDAELTAIIHLRLTQTRIETKERERQTTAFLVSLLGRDPGSAELRIEGALTPLGNVKAHEPAAVDIIVDRRPEVARMAETRRARSHDLTMLRRSRMPNVTLSVFAQRDGFSEQVIGGGLSLPVPLPFPLGRTLAGEISESEALARQVDADFESARREARLELVTARQAFDTAVAQNALFTDERAADAERSLASIAQEIRAGRLAISTALVAQQTLIDFLRARIATKVALCLASVELARTAGMALHGEQL